MSEGHCHDVDECVLGIHSCGPLERCQNTNGSFTCEERKTISKLLTTITAKPTTCRKGYRLASKLEPGDKDECVDIDECAEGKGCRDFERCTNYPGGYDCSPLCGPGWKFDRATKSCQDVDECMLGRHECRQVRLT